MTQTEGREARVRLFGEGQARRDWITAEQDLLETYVDEYVLSTEGADYEPTEHERELIRDALQGFLVDQDELLSKHLTRSSDGPGAREAIEYFQRRIHTWSRNEPSDRPKEVRMAAILLAALQGKLGDG